ncbi:S1C family serine protease [Deinococcus sp. Marseille-Q6407]|uniref:S1C family serine protease n=1 Tax=Deinococcus sp. Marseille-Q6407 TaxID=2969223 RepID=UPI0021BF5F6E|nr:S1C family serine protease [Deinococcus sp. Marseille-Q6407]
MSRGPFPAPSLRPLLAGLIVTGALAGAYATGQVTAQKALVVPDEVNTVEVVRQASPAVVQVNNTLAPEALMPGDDPVEVGTGFFYKKDLIVTAYHVVQNSEHLTVTLASGRTVPATVEGVDPGIDVAVLRVTAVGAPRTLAFGSSASLVQGQKLISIGSPLKIQNYVGTGIFSVMAPAAQIPRTDNLANEVGQYIVTTTSIQGGNSGGPIMDSHGAVVGIANANAAASSLSAGLIGIGIPGDLVKQTLTDLEQTGAPQRGNLGVTLVALEDLDPALRQLAGLVSNQGVLVDEIQAGSPAGRAGLRGSLRNSRGQLLAPLGDIIVAVDGQPVSKPFDVTSLVAAKRPGDTVRLTVWRDGRRQDLNVTLQQRTLEEFQSSQNQPGPSNPASQNQRTDNPGGNTPSLSNPGTGNGNPGTGSRGGNSAPGVDDGVDSGEGAAPMPEGADGPVMNTPDAPSGEPTHP